MRMERGKCREWVVVRENNGVSTVSCSPWELTVRRSCLGYKHSSTFPFPAQHGGSGAVNVHLYIPQTLGKVSTTADITPFYVEMA
jgi:hypothetical protein